MASYVVAHDVANERKLSGPFKVYDMIRWAFSRPELPEWAREGAQCPFCVQGSAAFIMTAALQDKRLRPISQAIIAAMAARAAGVFVMQYFQSMHGLQPNKF